MMSITDDVERVTLPILSLQVHGITVLQPIELIEKNLANYLAEQKKTLQNIRATDREDAELLHQYGRDLLRTHANIIRWGTPLRDFASYKYRHPDSLITI